MQSSRRKTEGGRMHLVFLASLVPHATPTSGYELANAAIIDALRREGVRVTVLGYAWPDRVAEVAADAIVLGAVDVRTAMASTPQKVRWLARAVGSGMTFASAKVRIASPTRVRTALADLGPYDGYVVNSVQLAGAYPELFHDRPRLFVAHNVEHRSALENAAASAGFQRVLFRREARLLRRIESALCSDARFVFTFSQEDRIALGLDDPARSAVLPLVVGREPMSIAVPRARRCDAALLGTWTWEPNRLGLRWFLDEVTPHLRPSFRVRIGGSVPPGIDAHHPGVEFIGRVPDAPRFLSESSIVPLVSRAGTGVQIKTLEAFELGLPTVATQRSLRGIEDVPANCRVTDDPVAFARALEHAVDHPVEVVDGRIFHERRFERLQTVIRAGLRSLGRPLPIRAGPLPRASDPLRPESG